MPLIELKLRLKQKEEPKLLKLPELKLSKELKKKDWKFKQETKLNKPRENSSSKNTRLNRKDSELREKPIWKN